MGVIEMAVNMPSTVGTALGSRIFQIAVTGEHRQFRNARPDANSEQEFRDEVERWPEA